MLGRRTRLTVEPLEPRLVPATTLKPLAAPVAIPGLSPAQVRRAYGFDQVAFGTVVGDGRGQTIAVVTAFDYPTAAQDLTTFSRTFGLPDPPSFVKVWANGQPRVDGAWAFEAALDVQWAHAAAPAANLVLVEARSDSLADMAAAVDAARRRPGVSVVSMSWGVAEFPAQVYYDALFTTPPGREAGAAVTFVAPAGDGGASGGPLWPAASPNVLAVGGTTLRVDAAGGFVAETAWAGGGGGVSAYAQAPPAQRTLTGDGRRIAPDVAYNAAEASGVAVYTSTPVNGQTGWLKAHGTSAGAPQWAGLLAVANQGRALVGKPALGGVLAEIYALPTTAFRDVVGGSNGFVAVAGFDAATGRGTPIANRVAAGLVGTVPPVTPPPGTPPPAPTPPPPPAATPKPIRSVLSSRVASFFRRAEGKVTTQVGRSA